MNIPLYVPIVLIVIVGAHILEEAFAPFRLLDTGKRRIGFRRFFNLEWFQTGDEGFPTSKRKAFFGEQVGLFVGLALLTLLSTWWPEWLEWPGWLTQYAWWPAALMWVVVGFITADLIQHNVFSYVRRKYSPGVATSVLYMLFVIFFLRFGSGKVNIIEWVAMGYGATFLVGNYLVAVWRVRRSGRSQRHHLGNEGIPPSIGSESKVVKNLRSTRGFRLVTEFVEQKPIYAKSWALVVGINEYQSRHNRLVNAVNDARAVARVLRDTHGFEEVHTLYDEEATRYAIMSWLRDELPACTHEHDRLIFFFAGHGITQPTRGGKRGYLVPADAEVGKYGNYIEMRELLFACDTIPAKHIFLILDCCFSGVAAVASRADPPPTPLEVNDSYLRRITEKHAWQILTAGDTDDQVADSGLRTKHSVFTGVLLDGLTGEADQNGDGLMTVTDLAAYVKPQVARQSEVLIGRGQMPFYSYVVGSGQGEFAFLLPDVQHVVDTTIPFDWVTIPAGQFLMGSDKLRDGAALSNEMPQHRVYLSKFRISRTPVTNAQYKQFVDATEHESPEHWENGKIPSGKENHPVVWVSWHDAQAFCQWANVRLPTEAEWEKAARGTDGRIYPWGNEEPDKSRTNFGDAVGDTTPVERYSDGVSPYGVVDMAGNVWEWTADWYDPNYYEVSPERNPTGPEDGNNRALRGGSFRYGALNIRCAYRHGYDPDSYFGNFGFRVVRHETAKEN